MERLRNRGFFPESAGAKGLKRLRLLLVALLTVSTGVSTTVASSSTTWLESSGSLLFANATRSAVRVFSGLRPSAPYVSALACVHTSRAQASSDGRLSSVEVAVPDSGLSGWLLDPQYATWLWEETLSSIASEPSCSGGGGSSTGGSPLALGLGPLDVLGVDVGQGSPLGAMVAAGGVPTTAAAAPRSGSGASAGGGGGGAGALGPASPPQDLDLIAVDWAEAVTLPLLLEHQAGRTTRLLALNGTIPALYPPPELPPQLLPPRLGSPSGSPASPLLLLYRRDWWDSLAASGAVPHVPPPTWEVLADVLTQLLNTDLNGDGQPDHVLCIDLQPGCKAWAVLAALYGAVAQPGGTRQGVWFRRADMSPRVASPAMAQAMGLMARLAAANAAPWTPGGNATSRSTVPVSPDEWWAEGGLEGNASSSSSSSGMDGVQVPACLALNPLFLRGRCLVTIDWAAAVVQLTQASYTGVSGRLGVSLLPGSTHVLWEQAPGALNQAAAPAAGAQTLASNQTASVVAAAAVTPAPAPSPECAAIAQLSTPSNVSGLTVCSPETCPYGAALDVQLPALEGRTETGVRQRWAGAASCPVLVNRAPLLGAATAVWLRPRSQAALRRLRAEEFAGLVRFELDLKYQTLMGLVGLGTAANASQQGTSPAASRGGSSPSPEEVAAAVELLGMHPGDLAALIEAVSTAVSHPNAVVDVALPHSSAYRLALDQLAVKAVELLRWGTAAAGVAQGPPTGGQQQQLQQRRRRRQRALQQGGQQEAALPEEQLQELLREADSRFRAVLQAFPYTGILQRLYWQAIGYTPGVEPSPVAAPSRGRSGTPAPVVAGATVGAVLGAALLVALAALYVAWRRRRRAWGETGTPAFKPPGASPATTLVTTDVQNSTLLWEVLSAEVMDACMSVHHGIMRQGIASSCGYEVFTEGDAFCVAFHGPDDALAFALEVQVALLDAPWPAELLEQADGCEVWARRAAHLPAGLPATPMGPGTAASTRSQLDLGPGVLDRGPQGASGSFLRVTAGSKKLRQLLTGATSSWRDGSRAMSMSYSNSLAGMALAAGVAGVSSPKPSLDGLASPRSRQPLTATAAAAAASLRNASVSSRLGLTGELVGPRPSSDRLSKWWAPRSPARQLRTSVTVGHGASASRDRERERLVTEAELAQLSGMFFSTHANAVAGVGPHSDGRASDQTLLLNRPARTAASMGPAAVPVTAGGGGGGVHGDGSTAGGGTSPLAGSRGHTSPTHPHSAHGGPVDRPLYDDVLPAMPYTQSPPVQAAAGQRGPSASASEPLMLQRGHDGSSVSASGTDGRETPFLYGAVRLTHTNRLYDHGGAAGGGGGNGALSNAPSAELSQHTLPSPSTCRSSPQQPQLYPTAPWGATSPHSSTSPGGGQGPGTGATPSRRYVLPAVCEGQPEGAPCPPLPPASASGSKTAPGMSPAPPVRPTLLSARSLGTRSGLPSAVDGTALVYGRFGHVVAVHDTWEAVEDSSDGGLEGSGSGAFGWMAANNSGASGDRWRSHAAPSAPAPSPASAHVTGGAAATFARMRGPAQSSSGLLSASYEPNWHAAQYNRRSLDTMYRPVGHPQMLPYRGTAGAPCAGPDPSVWAPGAAFAAAWAGAGAPPLSAPYGTVPVRAQGSRLSRTTSIESHREGEGHPALLRIVEEPPAPGYSAGLGAETGDGVDKAPAANKRAVSLGNEVGPSTRPVSGASPANGGLPPCQSSARGRDTLPSSMHQKEEQPQPQQRQQQQHLDQQQKQERPRPKLGRHASSSVLLPGGTSTPSLRGVLRDSGARTAAGQRGGAANGIRGGGSRRGMPRVSWAGVVETVSHSAGPSAGAEGGGGAWRERLASGQFPSRRKLQEAAGVESDRAPAQTGNGLRLVEQDEQEYGGPNPGQGIELGSGPGSRVVMPKRSSFQSGGPAVSTNGAWPALPPLQPIRSGAHLFETDEAPGDPSDGLLLLDESRLSLPLPPSAASGPPHKQQTPAKQQQGDQLPPAQDQDVEERATAGGGGAASPSGGGDTTTVAVSIGGGISAREEARHRQLRQVSSITLRVGSAATFLDSNGDDADGSGSGGGERREGDSWLRRSYRRGRTSGSSGVLLAPPPALASPAAMWGSDGAPPQWGAEESPADANATGDGTSPGQQDKPAAAIASAVTAAAAAAAAAVRGSRGTARAALLPGAARTTHPGVRGAPVTRRSSAVQRSRGFSRSDHTQPSLEQHSEASPHALSSSSSSETEAEESTGRGGAAAAAARAAAPAGGRGGGWHHDSLFGLEEVEAGLGALLEWRNLVTWDAGPAPDQPRADLHHANTHRPAAAPRAVPAPDARRSAGGGPVTTGTGMAPPPPPSPSSGLLAKLHLHHHHHHNHHHDNSQQQQGGPPPLRRRSALAIEVPGSETRGKQGMSSAAGSPLVSPGRVPTPLSDEAAGDNSSRSGLLMRLSRALKRAVSPTWLESPKDPSPRRSPRGTPPGQPPHHHHPQHYAVTASSLAQAGSLSGGSVLASGGSLAGGSPYPAGGSLTAPSPRTNNATPSRFGSAPRSPPSALIPSGLVPSASAPALVGDSVAATGALYDGSAAPASASTATNAPFSAFEGTAGQIAASHTLTMAAAGPPASSPPTGHAPGPAPPSANRRRPIAAYAAAVLGGGGNSSQPTSVSGTPTAVTASPLGTDTLQPTDSDAAAAAVAAAAAAPPSSILVAGSMGGSGRTSLPYAPVSSFGGSLRRDSLAPPSSSYPHLHPPSGPGAHIAATGSLQLHLGTSRLMHQGSPHPATPDAQRISSCFAPAPPSLDTLAFAGASVTGGGRRGSATTMGGGAYAPGSAPCGGSAYFDALFRDMNAAASSDAMMAGGGGWAQAAACTVAGVLRMLFERLSASERLALEGTGHGGTMAAEALGRGPGAAVDEAPSLVLRGLRVRVGIHSGPTAAEVEASEEGGVTVVRYGGDFLATCKAVGDAAVGGMVVLSGSAFRALHQHLRPRSPPAALEALLLHLGDHVLAPPPPRYNAQAAHAWGAAADYDSARGGGSGGGGQFANAPYGYGPAAGGDSLGGLPAAEEVRELYGAVSPATVSRLALLPAPVRTHREVVPGCLAAPAGLVAPVFCNVMGVETLLAWERLLLERHVSSLANLAAAAAAAAAAPGSGVPAAAAAGVAPADFPRGAGGSIISPFSGGSVVGGPEVQGVVRAALEMLRGYAQEAAARHGGYVVAASADGGHWVLVFGCAAAAVEWGLDMLGAMLRAAWPEGLLEHELAEEVWEGPVVVKRGLRLRIGVDYGRAMVRLVPRTGRLDYVGKAMNRAARIAAKAKAATLLVSGAAWSSARPSLEPGVSATPLGSLALKGVKEPLELWALRAAGEQQLGHQQHQQVHPHQQGQLQAQTQAQQQQQQ